MPDQVGNDGDGVGSGMTRTGGQTGPSHSFKDVSVRDGTQKRCSEGENGTIT